MVKRRVNLLAVSFVLFLASCSANAGLWSEKTAPGVTQKSQEITKIKMDFVELAKKLNPTVVNVFTTHVTKFSGMGKGGMQRRGYQQDEMFKFFKQFMGRDFEMPRERKS
ncbi:MAG: hypothetical protein V1647_05410, partial [Pseudomonadota bacterium]